MPKRTNDFQRLMHYIYSQLAPKDVCVTESASLKERSNNVEREVDILLEQNIFGMAMRIAIECRGRSRKDDIEWIDSLIGKFQNLDVHKVIAVSKSGFSKGAIKKAADSNIETRTLKQALDTDWSAEFVKITLLSFTRTSSVEAKVTTIPQISQLHYQSCFVVEDKNTIGTLEEVLRDIYDFELKDEFNQYFNENFIDIIKTVDDFDKDVLIDEIIGFDNLFIRDMNDQIYKLASATLTYKTVFEKNQEDLKHYTHYKSLISSGMVRDETTQMPYDVTIVQIEGKDEGRVFVKSTHHKNDYPIKFRPKKE
jgi:Restriction endonuclease